ncbi:MAG: hypothetical protein ACXVHX_37495 [Solirubrobacteraceae bacterium]
MAEAAVGEGKDFCWVDGEHERGPDVVPKAILTHRRQRIELEDEVLCRFQVSAKRVRVALAVEVLIGVVVFAEAQ